jgi:hypothetical protein
VENPARNDDRFVLDHLSVGGPYRVDVRAIGFSQLRRTGIVVALGQRVTLDVALPPAAARLPELPEAPVSRRWRSTRSATRESARGERVGRVLGA